MTGLGRVLFPHQANGSLIEKDGKVIGSVLLGQLFLDDNYFHSFKHLAKSSRTEGAFGTAINTASRQAGVPAAH
jgi:K+-transporting ATPase c subunit